MTVFLVFLATTAAVQVAATIAPRGSLRRAWPVALRAGLAALFLMTGTTHFVGLRDDLVAMVPPALPNPELLVTLTGLLELAGAIGLLIGRTAAWAAGGLAVLLVAMFPANVYAATAGLTLGGEPATALLPRTAMQLVYVAAAIAIVVRLRAQAVRPRALRHLTATLPPANGPASLDVAATRSVAEAAGQPGRGLVLVSRLELRSLRHVPGFLIDALRLRRAVRTAPGARTLRLAAQPLARTFWTWSEWDDENRMNDYVRSDLHGTVMTRHRRHMRVSAFRTFDVAGAPQDWSAVRQLFEAPGRAARARMSTGVG